MAKTSRPDRKKNMRRERTPKEFEETTLSVDRVTRVVKGGRRMRFRAVVVVGDKKGRVGIGTGKSNEVIGAVQKATAVAKRDMIKVPLVNGTLPHAVNTKFKSAIIRLLPASEGTGVIAGGALRVILEHAGVKDVLSKRYGTTNKLVNAQAVMQALASLKGEYKAPEDDKPAESDEAALTKEQSKVKTVSKKDVKDGTLTSAKKDTSSKKQDPKTSAKKSAAADKKASAKKAEKKEDK